MWRLLLLACCLAAALNATDVGDAPAGQTQLEQLQRQIDDMHALLADIDRRLTAMDERGADLLVAAVRSAITGYTDDAAPTPTSVDQLQTWYLQAMRERHGFDPLEPAPAWTHLWMTLREQEHALHDQYEDVHAALRRLERLRDRLRRQLAASTARP